MAVALVLLVIGHVDDGTVLGNVFLALDDDLDAGVKQTGVETTFYKKQARTIFPIRLEFSNDPFHE